MDKNQNITRNQDILYFNMVIKTLELVFIIFLISYYFAITWMIMCEFIEDFIHQVNYKDSKNGDFTFTSAIGIPYTENYNNTFIIAYDL